MSGILFTFTSSNLLFSLLDLIYFFLRERKLQSNVIPPRIGVHQQRSYYCGIFLLGPTELSSMDCSRLLYFGRQSSLNESKWESGEGNVVQSICLQRSCLLLGYYLHLRPDRDILAQSVCLVWNDAKTSSQIFSFSGVRVLCFPLLAFSRRLLSLESRLPNSNDNILPTPFSFLRIHQSGEKSHKLKPARGRISHECPTVICLFSSLFPSDGERLASWFIDQRAPRRCRCRVPSARTLFASPHYIISLYILLDVFESHTKQRHYVNMAFRLFACLFGWFSFACWLDRVFLRNARTNTTNRTMAHYRTESESRHFNVIVAHSWIFTEKKVFRSFSYYLARNFPPFLSYYNFCVRTGYKEENSIRFSLCASKNLSVNECNETLIPTW